MIITQTNTINKILDEIGIALDLTEAQYKLVEDRYKAVGYSIVSLLSQIILLFFNRSFNFIK